MRATQEALLKVVNRLGDYINEHYEETTGSPQRAGVPVGTALRAFVPRVLERVLQEATDELASRRKGWAPEGSGENYCGPLSMTTSESEGTPQGFGQDMDDSAHQDYCEALNDAEMDDADAMVQRFVESQYYDDSAHGALDRAQADFLAGLRAHQSPDNSTTEPMDLD